MPRIAVHQPAPHLTPDATLVLHVLLQEINRLRQELGCPLIMETQVHEVLRTAHQSPVPRGSV